MTYDPIDPYVWFDPFEERTRAVQLARQVASAREDGARMITRTMAQEAKFPEKLDEAVRYVARRIAEEHMMKEMRNHHADYLTEQRRMEKMRDEMYHGIGLPAMHATLKHGVFDIVPDFQRPSNGPVLELKFYTVAPIDYHLRITIR